MREFEQMEMQFFIRPGTQLEWYNYWKETRKNGMKASVYRQINCVITTILNWLHYADAALDIEFEFFGWKELEGILAAVPISICRSMPASAAKIQYFDNDLDENGKPYGNYTPFVVETSVGARPFVPHHPSLAYAEEKWTKEDGTEDSRVVLRIPAKIAPTKLAILPLMKKTDCRKSPVN